MTSLINYNLILTTNYQYDILCTDIWIFCRCAEKRKDGFIMARFTLPRDSISAGCNGRLRTRLPDKGASSSWAVTRCRRTAFWLLKISCTRPVWRRRSLKRVEPDPSVENRDAAAQAMRDFQPDVILSIGGGSPMDAAKAMWVFYEHPEKTFDDIKDPSPSRSCATRPSSRPSPPPPAPRRK